MQVDVDSPAPLEDHWARHPWAPGQRKLAWHLTFARSSAMASAFATAAPVLDDPFLTPVPFAWAHLTLVSGTGRTARPSAEALAGVAELRASRIFVSREGPVLLVDEPADGLQALWCELAGPELVAERGRLWPHSSLAYSHGPADPSPLAARLRALPLEPFVIDGADLTLMQIRQDPDRCYRWDVLDQVPLG